MMQGSLFDRQEPRAPPGPPAASRIAKHRVPLERHEVESAWGKPDGKGNLFWRKMHKELDKLPVSCQEFFNHITIVARPEHLDQLEKCLRLFNKANEFDKVDFDESRGRL